jgi:hypothetical protein
MSEEQIRSLESPDERIKGDEKSEPKDGRQKSIVNAYRQMSQHAHPEIVGMLQKEIDQDNHH